MKTEQFLKIKKNDIITINYNSGISSNNEVKLVATSKPIFSAKYNLHKLTLVRESNPNACKFYAYLRGDKISFAFGDMAISLNNINL